MESSTTSLTSFLDLIAIDSRAKPFLHRAGSAILESCSAYDLARSAEKMTDPKSVGERNAAWSSGPYLCAPRDQSDIDRSMPYILRVSKEFDVAIQIVHDRSSTLPLRLAMPVRTKGESRVEHVIARLAIIEQFEIFKRFIKTFGGPYNAATAKAWNTKVPGIWIDCARELADLRNAIAHGDEDNRMASMKDAVDFFYKCVVTGTYLSSRRDS